MHNHAAGTGDLVLLGPAQAVVATGRDRPEAAGRESAGSGAVHPRQSQLPK
jgi:hypothetical protein